MGRDVRVCVVGDSFVAGVGDPEHRGWVGRVAADVPMTVYNLGVRRETSRDVLDRWAAECRPRLPDGVEGRVVVSFGVNDTTLGGGRRRVAPDESVHHLGALLDGARAAGWPALVIGPPPVADVAQTERIASLSAAFGRCCAARIVAYLPVVEALRTDPVWTAEVAEGDGSHPGGGGYSRLAALVRPAWEAWLAR